VFVVALVAVPAVAEVASYIELDSLLHPFLLYAYFYWFAYSQSNPIIA
jgi:hypothetical protein